MTTADEHAATIAAEVADLDYGILNDYELDLVPAGAERRYAAVERWLNELALDVEVGRNLRTNDVTTVTVLRSLGGPNAWVTFRSSGPTEVLVVFGRDRATRLVDRGHTADLVVDMIAELSA